MKKGIALILATASTAGLAVPAMAQDNEAFTGPRVEGLAGYDSVKPGSSTDIDNAEDIDQSIDGVAYGIGAGYDFAIGGAVVGVEGEYVWSDADTEYDTVGFDQYGVGNVETNGDLYLGVRAGVLATPRTLVYAKGGYTNAGLDILATDNVTDIESDVDFDGWRVGGGVEQAVTENVFAKVEYRYSNYDEGEFEAPDGTESNRFDVDLDRHQVMVGVGYRF